MAIPMNLNAAGRFSVPGGYPVRLLTAGDTMLQGVIPPTVASVSAVVQTEKYSANVHLGIFTMPTAQNGNDNAVVAQTDLVGLSTSQQTITVNASAAFTASNGLTIPDCYVVRLWVDSITGSNAETISRDGTTAVANLPSIPTAVKVVSVTVA